MKSQLAKNSVVLLVASLLSSGLAAVEYSSQSELQVSTQYDDNARLSYDDPINLFGYSVKPKVDWQAKEEHWNVKAVADLRFNNYDLQEWNSDDQYLTFAGSYQTERQSFGLNTSAIKDSTRTSEYDTSGRIGFSAERREQLIIAPSWAYLLTGRNQLSLQVSGSNTEYDSDNYTDYKYLSGQGGWTYIFNEDVRFTFNLTYSDYKPDYRGPFDIGLPGLTVFSGLAASRTKSVGYLVGGEYAFTEQLTITGNIGSTEGDSKYTLIEIPNGNVDCQAYENANLPLPACNIEDYKSTNLQGDVSLDYLGERNKLKLGVSLQNQPTSNGYVMQYLRVSVDWVYQLSEKSKFSTYLSGGENKSIDEETAAVGTANPNRNFANVILVYNYRFMENWHLSTTAKYHWQEYESLAGHASASGVSLGITYRPTKKFW